MSTLRLMAIDAICQRGSVRDSDVALLRRTFALETQIAATDVDCLFRAHALARVQDPSWADFFIETLTDYVVHELEPTGYVTATHAGWLIARISSAGRVRTKTEFDLLLNILDKARWVPESLVLFALAQIRDAVMSGEGPLRTGGDAGPGHITLTEVEQLRALLFAYGNEGPTSITQTEAEVLIDIDGAITRRLGGSLDTATLSPLDAWPVEAWRDLFQKSLASAILSASGYTGPTREEALSETRTLAGLGLEAAGAYLREGSLSGIAAARGAVLDSYRPLPPEARALLRLELQRIEIITGEPVAPADAGKLALLLATPVHLYGAAGRLLHTLNACGFALHPAFAAGKPARNAVQAA